MQPGFISEHGGFFLTLKNLNYRLSEKEKIKEKIKGEDTEKKKDRIVERTELVYSAISDNPDVTIKELCLLLDITKKQAETAIKKLKDTNRIHRTGNDRYGKWIID